MDKWIVLGIEKTDDEDMIKSAYRKKLASVNPEDDSEGFMELRKAYEDAIYEIKHKNETKENDDADSEEKNSKKSELMPNSSLADFS